LPKNHNILIRRKTGRIRMTENTNDKKTAMLRIVPPFRGAIALAGLLLGLAQPVSAGVVTITMIENAGSISVSMSGSLNFTSAGFATTAGFSDYIGPANGTIGFGSSATLTQGWSIGDTTLEVQSASPVQSQIGLFFSPFGSGGFAQNMIGGYSGSSLFIYFAGVAVDRSYVSGATLSGSGSISGSFASNGITAGTSTTQFTLNGSANTITVQRSATPVGVPAPSPASLLALIVGGAALRRWRSGRRKQLLLEQTAA
jgi:hypothetical protein